MPRAAGGFAPKPPASGGWGLAPRPPKQPPIANFWLCACCGPNHFTTFQRLISLVLTIKKLFVQLRSARIQAKATQ